MVEKRQVKATPVQALMATLMGVAYLALFIFTIPELKGIFQGDGGEDTYSEWVWDLPAWAVYTIAAIHLVAGVALVWSSGHFIEGMLRRS